ncbi:serine/threonine protein kinase [Nitrosospira lacus]|uniref:non-specific serine/threonine protein kinase n=1 Tax=Nitrosospira lacus TaxID=1288494 RepID=A0A1W6SQC2_9PROT|nr:protein kinase [Nitrosospira lacus]ARO87995.1 serine/threonine protein kinase [Nitrosospira lacus]
MLENIGRFKILGELGRGGMAVVYKAYDPNINRPLAIKVLLEERCANKEYRSRFLAEAKAAGLLSHPNIVTIFDIGEINDRPYIVMELLEGDPLDEYMKSTPDRSLREDLAIGIQLAKALHYAHSKGIVHRDIKPSNIIRVKGGNNIKITDFGIAHVEDPEQTRQTQMGEVLGTPQYMSPEQALGRHVDARSDLYSVGVVLYQLMTGKKPFEGGTIATLLLQITTTEPAPIDQIVPGIPRSVKLIVERLLKKDPEKRFQSGQDLANALIDAVEEIRQDEMQRAKPKVLPIRVRWTFIMIAIVSITMIIGATWLYKRQYASIVQQATEYGSSMVRFMAAESAEKVFNEDWIFLEVFIQDAMTGQRFGYLSLVDSHGLVRGSSVPDKIGKPYQKIENGELIGRIGDVSIQRYDVSKSSSMMDFDAPVIFRDKEIGRIHLGMQWDPLEELSKQIVFTMLLLMIVTVAAASVVAYALASAISSPIKTLRKSFEEMKKGNLSYRIAQTRKDEFGELFQSFDEMAETLQKSNEDMIDAHTQKNNEKETDTHGAG